MNLQDEYNQQGGGDDDQSQDPSQSQQQDLTIPGAAVAQIVQAIQQQDCSTVCKLMAQIISGGSEAPPQ